MVTQSIPQAQRREATRAALIRAGRKLFVAKGYAESGTPEIVAAANVTRGALYHHFDGKQGLFHAVALADARVVSGALQPDFTRGPDKAILQMAEQYLDEMLYPGRVKLLLQEASAALDPDSLSQIHALAGGDCLSEAVEALSRAAAPFPRDAVTYMLHASLERAAIEVLNGADRASYIRGLSRFLRGLTIRMMGG